MNGKRKFVKAVAGRVSQVGILVCLAMLLLAVFGPGSAHAQTSGFVYVANIGGNVSAYTIDGATGALTPVPGSPFPAGTSPLSVAVDPMGRFAYVANEGSPVLGGNVSAYTIDGATGALTPVPGSPFPAGAGPHSVAVDPTGQFAYVANANSGNVSAYTIDGATGALTPVPGSPFPAGPQAFSVAVDPTGRFAYVANEASGNVSAYIIDGATGALTPVPGSPFLAGAFPHSVAVDATGRFAYVANEGSSNVSAYTIDGATGALTPVPGSPFPAGTFPRSVAVDPTGRFAYVASSNVSAYTIDGATGALTPVPGSPFPAGTFPRSVTADPTGRFAYVANFASSSNNVSAYTIDGATGALTPVPGSPFPAGSGPAGVAATAGPTIPPDSFASFSAKVDINLASSSFDINSTFTLRTGSPGIDPLTQPVTLTVGAFTTTIRAGSFQQNPHGFVFDGILNGVALEVIIIPQGGNSFAFRAEGAGASNLPTTNPVTVGLTIGNNAGTTTVTADIQ
ncbi:MAG TPA: beta-propeller fold lactonase family protein [Candidatus Acidoferrales bacterium]|nr:beta-propeller fold lactonase family protein [Candidatus Acidoferrales bacterium]